MKRRRRRRRNNPTALQWGLIALGGLGAAGLGFLTYRFLTRPKQALSGGNLPKLPPPPEGAGAPSTSPCGPDYPGFEEDADGSCSPTTATPPGIYVGEGCTDFVFVEGEEGAQLDYLEALIADAAASSAEPAAASADPIGLATDFFDEFWGECTWPPPEGASARVVHLFEAIVYAIGHEVVNAGGRVYGTNAPEIVDEQIADRLAGIGLPDFDPDLVAEIDIPEIDIAGGPSGPAEPPGPTVDYTQVPMFPMGAGSELHKHNKPGVGLHTIAITLRKVTHPALGQTTVVADWWAWQPGVVLSKANAFRTGTSETTQQALVNAKAAIDAYFTVQADSAE